MTSRGCVDLGFACVDTARHGRRGFPEVIYCQSKTPREIIAIARTLGRDPGAPLLLTRLCAASWRRVRGRVKGLTYEPRAGLAYRRGLKTHRVEASVIVVTAGTSDIPVAEEARWTLELMGVASECLYDVGVAGVHRVLAKRDILRRADVIIVVAGMEGALASVVSGLVACPVVAVPTSCGYGSSFEGLSALLTMLNSCSPGIATMNIDNGFGAGYFAGLIAQKSAKCHGPGAK